MSTDEINDAIRAQVEAELPTPRNGFATDDRADEHRAAHEDRFMALINDPAKWVFAAVLSS